MKLKIRLFYTLLFLAGLLNAQPDFKSGFIITNSLDTLYGEIDYRGDLLMSTVCKFKSKSGEIEKYTPNDINAFRFTDSKFYISKQVDDRKIFLEYLIKGKVSMYYVRDENGDHYYLDREGVKLSEIPYDTGIRTVDGKQMFFESKKHIGLLNYYMQDAPDFVSRIQKVKKPEHNNLIKLAEDYHNNVCENEECIIYEKQVSLIRILPEVITGVVNYTNNNSFTSEHYLNVGIIGHIWMPRTSEKLYIRTGFLFSNYGFNGEDKNTYRIPIQLEYIYPTGRIRPRIACGISFYRAFKERPRAVSFNTGANIKITKKIFVSATADIDFNPSLLVLPESLRAYSIQVGLFINI